MKKTDSHRKYIWQHEDWPHFRWDADKLIDPLSRLSSLHGQLYSRMRMLGFNKKSQTLLSALTDDLMSSSEIEGISLNPNSIRSSIAKKLGIEEDHLAIDDRYIEGLVEVMLDATHNCNAELSVDRLFGWHCALFPTGRSGMYKITVGDWRKGAEPMQVVSGAMGHEKIHFEALPSDKVPETMNVFINWCNSATLNPILMSAVAHLWFVTIHPFDDGNGRLSRTIADMFLSKLDGGDSKYYSVSAEINRNKRQYYTILESTQKGDLDITSWLLWYFDCIEKSICRALEGVESTVRKALYWNKFQDVAINERQRKVINRLWDGFEGKMTSSKWAKICKCSQDTALRDINDLIAKDMLVPGNMGGRSTCYLLPE